MKIDIPGVDFAGLARQAIAEKLTEALVGADDAIRKIVGAALTQKVNDRGQISQYSSDNKVPYVEWVAGEMIRAAAHQVLQAKVDALRPAIERAVEANLKQNAKAIAQALTGAFITASKDRYTVGVHVSFSAREQ
jgi:hypothetical protein